MTDQQIKELFSKKILNMQDKAAETVLRTVLFGTRQNNIDWQDAYRIALITMPELIKLKS